MTTFEQDILDFEKEIYRYAIKLTKDTDKANDLVQSTIYKALTNKDKFVEGTNLRGWLMRIIYNDFINTVRYDNRFVSSSTKDFEEINNRIYKKSNTNLALENMYYNELKEIVDSLKDNDAKKAFILYTKDFKYKEIAERMDKPVGTIKNYIFRIKERIKEKLKWIY